MIEEEQDFWRIAEQQDVDALVCTTNNMVKMNGSLVMGRGIAEQFNAKFKYLAWNWGQIVDKYKDIDIEDYHLLLDGPRMLGHNKFYVVGLQTKFHWKDDSPIELIEASCKNLKKLVDIMQWQKIIMTRPGCGNGGLQWRTVRSKIRKYLDDRFVVCHKDV